MRIVGYISYRCEKRMIYIYIYLEHRMTICLQNLEKWQDFLVICPYLAVFGDKWHVWRILINFGNILKTYLKIARLDNIEKMKNIDKLLETYWKHIGNILETYWKILVSWLPPHACNLEFGILAYMPYDQKIWSYAKWPKKYSRLGVPGIYIYNTILNYIYPEVNQHNWVSMVFLETWSTFFWFSISMSQQQRGIQLTICWAIQWDRDRR